MSEGDQKAEDDAPIETTTRVSESNSETSNSENTIETSTRSPK